MSVPLALLKFTAKATLNAVAGGVGGDFAVEVLPEIARHVWTWWAKDRSEAERKADVQALVQAPTTEVQRQVKEVVREVAGTAPIDQQLHLETYLNEMPAVARQSLMRRDDPRGATIPSHMPLQKPDDLLPFLPRRLPRFKPGDHPLQNVDWELVRLLGVGGFGEVWKARNPHAPNLQAALKFCLDPTACEHLLKYEAGILARVMSQGEHPGIVRLRQTYLSADPPCLEYEFIEGSDLTGAIHAHQAKKGPLPPDMVTKIVLHLARAVGHVHKLNPPIVHRDLKPANVLVRTKEGKREFLITDFGIGGAVTTQALQQTRQGTTSQSSMTSIKGAHTPLYASPEQKRGEPPDPRDDVHALGVIWYQLLVGDFSAGAPTGGAWKKTLTQRGLSESLLQLLESCFETEAEHRPANASILARRIEAGFEVKTVGTTSKFVQDRMDALEVLPAKANDRTSFERQGPTRVVVIAGCLALMLFLCGIGLMAGLIAYHRGGMGAKESSVAASPKDSDRLMREPEKQEVQVQPPPAPAPPVEVQQDPVPSLPAAPQPTAPRRTAKPTTVEVQQDPIPPQPAAPPAFSADDPKATLAWLISISVEARKRTKNALADRAHREAMQQTMDQLNGRQVSWKATLSNVTVKAVILSPIKEHGATLTLASLAENQPASRVNYPRSRVGPRTEAFQHHSAEWVAMLKRGDFVRITGTVEHITMSTHSAQFTVVLSQWKMEPVR